MRVSFSMVTGWRAHVLRACAPLAAAVSLASCGSVPAKQGVDASVGDTGTDDAGIDAPPKACTTTTCTNDVLEVCGSDGMVESTEQCALGCFTDNTRCNVIDPSNGLAPYVDQAAQEDDATLPDGSTINTDNGSVTSPNGAIAIATATVAQPGGPTLRVLIAKSFTLDNVRVTGALPLALVARDEITVSGVLDASADGAARGAGALSCGATGAGGAPPAGHFERVRAGNSGGYPTYLWSINGAGGGGFGTAGGVGGVQDAMTSGGAGGIVNGQATLIPLRGGCNGYGANATYLGAGGGAIQLVSGTRVRLVDGGSAKGIVHVGGGSARAGVLGKDNLDDTTPVYGPGGGGSGGGILIEAPVLVLEDGTALLAAGGGGGGYGACTPQPNGSDAPPSVTTPTGGTCPAGTTPTAFGGNGATAAAGGVGGSTTGGGSGGGGGGGLGRIRLNTADGQYTTGTGAVVRGAETTGMVGAR